MDGITTQHLSRHRTSAAQLTLSTPIWSRDLSASETVYIDGVAVGGQNALILLQQELMLLLDKHSLEAETQRVKRETGLV